jgi:CAAX protease family protein
MARITSLCRALDPQAHISDVPLPRLLLLLLGTAASTATGFTLTRVVGGTEGIGELLGRFKRWRVGIRWYAAAIFTTSVAVTATLLSLATTLSPTFTPVPLTGMNVLPLIPQALVIGVIAGFLEEWGWTGFALPRLLTRYPAFPAALTLGIAWGVWHAPLLFWLQPYRGTVTGLSFLGGIAFMAAIVPYRILISWVYINGEASLLLAIIMHACYDASLGVLSPTDLSDLQYVQSYGALTITLWIAVAVVVAVFGVATLSRPSRREMRVTVTAQAA